jgi:hypothetical protein
MSQPNTSSENGNSHRPAVDVLNENPHTNSRFYDPSNPLLAPPKQLDETKQKSRKRKLIIVCFVFVLLAGSAFALHRLLKVNRVNVSVQADTRHDAQSVKTKEDSKGSDNNSSVEAIRLARQALGSDSPTNNGSASPTPTPSPQDNSTDPTTVGLRSLSGTIYQPKPSDNGSSNARTGSTSNTTPDQQTSGATSAAQELAQSRANTTQTIYVGDFQAKAPATAQINPPSLRPDTKARSKTTENPAVLPPFGTMLPVRTQGVVFTLRNNSYARLELVRDMKGSGWSLPKGTVLIGRASGSEYDRAFITVIGYVDSRDNRLVKMSGEVLGSDGGSGIQGKRVVVDSGGLKRALSKIASSGMQAAGLLASGFGGQRTVILDGAGNRIISPITDEASRMFGDASGDKRAFVKVEAGRPAYVMVADLPKDRPAIDAPGEDQLRTGAFTDRELMELLLFGTREDVSGAIPLMTDEQKTLALKTLATGHEKK